MGQCCGCCDDEMKIVVVGTSGSGVTTTALTLRSFASNANHGVATASPSPARSAPDWEVLISPSVALRAFSSVPFATCGRADMSGGDRMRATVRNRPRSLTIVDAGPVTHPGYRDAVDLSHHLRTSDGVIVVIDATRTLGSQRAHKVMEIVASGKRPSTPVFILVNKYDVLADDLIVPEDIVRAQFPLLTSVRAQTPWRCLPGAAANAAFDPSHILAFLLDPGCIDPAAHVVLLFDDTHQTDSGNNDQTLMQLEAPPSHAADDDATTARSSTATAAVGADKSPLALEIESSQQQRRAESQNSPASSAGIPPLASSAAAVDMAEKTFLGARGFASLRSTSEASSAAIVVGDGGASAAEHTGCGGTDSLGSSVRPSLLALAGRRAALPASASADDDESERKLLDAEHA